MNSFSYELRKILVKTAIRGSIDDAIELIQDLTGVVSPKPQAVQILEQSSADFDAFYERRSENSSDNNSELPILVLTTDDKGIVMRPDSLREQTREKAMDEPTNGRGSLSKTEKSNRKRMAQVASVYLIFLNIGIFICNKSTNATTHKKFKI